MSAIRLRKAKVADLPILYSFEQGIVEAERPFDETLKTGHINYYDIKVMIESEETEVIVAVTDRDVIGSAYLNIRPAKEYVKHSHFGYLGFMYVRPVYRGRGVSKKIIEEIKNILRTKNISELYLDVYSENEPAISAYEKAGFKKHMINMRVRI